jgi:hypothetical protein
LKSKIIFIIHLLLLVPIAILVANGGEIVPPGTPFWPSISIEEALKLGERYIQEKQTDGSRQYIHSIQLNYRDKGEKIGSHWRIQFSSATPRRDGEQALIIFMDGTVKHEFPGP